jgi:transketolase
LSVDIRDAFFDEIYALAQADRNLVFLTDDMDAFALRQFKATLPKQFINIGVAEQNMINLAAGLASCGKRVFAYGIAPFVTLRCYEQIKVNLCSMNLGVTVIGVGSGFSFGFDGPTHHGTQDVAIMRALPEITILNPSDAGLAAACARWSYESNSPVYVRLDKGVFPDFPAATDGAGFRIIRPLQARNIIATGFMVSEAAAVADELNRQGDSVGVVDLFRLKPIDERLVRDVLAKSQAVMTLEDNAVVGGLGSAIAEIVADNHLDVSVTRCAIPDKQYIVYGTREWFHTVTGIDRAGILRRIAAGN